MDTKTLLTIGCTFWLFHCSSGDPPIAYDEPEQKSGTKTPAGGSTAAPPSSSSSVLDGSAPIPNDAAAPGASCDPNKPFSTPVRVAGFDPNRTLCRPRLSSDELSIFFNIKVNGTPKPAFATRSTKNDSFGPVMEMTTLESRAVDRDPELSADGMTLFFSTSRDGDEDIYVATRSATDAVFGVPNAVANVNTYSYDRDPYFRQAGNELWFSSARGGSWEIYRAPFGGVTGFGVPQIVPELVSNTGQSYEPMITEDGLTVVFVSERLGGQGGTDLWMAHRTATTLPFSPPSPINEVNSPWMENGGWLSSDGCRLYFSSDRGSEHASLYVATRQ